MKKIFFAACSIMCLFASSAYAAGQVTLINNNKTAINSTAKVTFKVTSSTGATWESPKLDANSNSAAVPSHILSGASSFSVDIKKSGSYQRCLYSQPYNPTWKDLNVYGWMKNTSKGNFQCQAY